MMEATRAGLLGLLPMDAVAVGRRRRKVLPPLLYIRTPHLLGRATVNSARQKLIKLTNELVSRLRPNEV